MKRLVLGGALAVLSLSPLVAAGDAPSLLLQLEPEAVESAGLELGSATASQLAPEVVAYGRVLDAVPVVEVVASWNAARAQFERADKERRRVEELARGAENASARDLEAARAAASSARADADLAEARLVSVLGASATDDPRLLDLARKLALRSAALIRIDVPASSLRPEPERGARLTSHPQSSTPLASEYLGVAPTSNPLLPGWGLLFYVPSDPPPAGTPVRARIRCVGDVAAGVDVPASALVRNAGELFVFAKRGEGSFERVLVVARSREDGSWFVERGLQPGEEVVVAGAQMLLSTQLFGSSAAEED